MDLPFLMSERLFESRRLRLELVRCASTRRGPSDDEERSAPTLSFFWSGMNIRHRRGVPIVASSASVLFADAGEIYNVSHPCGSGEITLSLVLAPATLHEILGPREPASVAAHASCDASLFLAQRQLAARVRRGGRDRLAIEEAALSLAERSLRLLSRRPPPPSAGRAQQHAELAHAAEVELGRRLFDPDLTLDDLAAALGVSPFHLSRTYRQVRGTALFARRNAWRLHAAVDAIAADRHDLTSLALELGFSSHSHFTLAFRSRFGITPSAVREELRARALAPRAIVS